MLNRLVHTCREGSLRCTILSGEHLMPPVHAFAPAVHAFLSGERLVHGRTSRGRPVHAFLSGERLVPPW